MGKKSNLSLHDYSSSWGMRTPPLLPFFFVTFFAVVLVISLSYDKVDYIFIFDPQQQQQPEEVVVVAAVSNSNSNSTSTTTVEEKPKPKRKPKRSIRGCELFKGRWVLDNATHPLYSGLGCTYMHDEVACEKYGRKDLKHQQWRWQPHGCDLPRFDAKKLLRSLRGKRMVFVGDSLNRNQWVSMVCMAESGLSSDNKSMQHNGSLMSFKAEDYNASIDFYWAPLLVESNCDDPVHHRLSDRIMRANSIQTHARQWEDADILVFNSYLWWKKPGMKMKVLYGSFEDENKKMQEMEMIEGFELALKAWANWLELHHNPNTLLFFVSLSPQHCWADEWGRLGNYNCYNETEPIYKEGHIGRGSDYNMMHIVEHTVAELKQKGVNVQILNVTQLSEYRKDGHPSIYRKWWVTLREEQLANPSSYSDCTHWCVPGVPDVWNELLYAYIISSQEQA